MGCSEALVAGVVCLLYAQTLALASAFLPLSIPQIPCGLRFSCLYSLVHASRAIKRVVMGYLSGCLCLTRALKIMIISYEVKHCYCMHAHRDTHSFIDIPPVLFSFMNIITLVILFASY